MFLGGSPGLDGVPPWLSSIIAKTQSLRCEQRLTTWAMQALCFWSLGLAMLKHGSSL